MQSVKFLHIGDVHYPERNDQPALDWKDKAVTGALVHQLTPDPFKNVADEIRKLLLDDPAVKGVLISGDLTSRGDIDGYRECVAFLARVLEIGTPSVWHDKVLAVVPGNHDVPRGDVDVSGADLFKKFAQTAAIWDGVSPGVFSPSVARTVDVRAAAGCMTRVIALNTCIGCGEKRYLTAEIQQELYDLISKYASSTPNPKCFDVIGEQLDTPAILESHVTDVEKEIQGLNQPAVALVLGHHALLPQFRVRVDLYTELLNGGRFRAVLATLGINVLYCHGHLHEDPIEVVSHPALGRGRLIVVSAPLFRDGFNVIELFYDASGHPIGCAIHPYRLEPFGSVRRRSTVRVPLLAPGRGESHCDDACLAILASLGRDVFRFKDLAKQLLPVTETALIADLQLLEWLNLVDIRNREEEPVYWNITRTGP